MIKIGSSPIRSAFRSAQLSVINAVFCGFKFINPVIKIPAAAGTNFLHLLLYHVPPRRARGFRPFPNPDTND